MQMDGDRWRRIEEIYHLALSRSGIDREAFLQRICGSDVGLRDEVPALLQQQGSSRELFAIRDGVLKTGFVPESPDRAGQRLGVFELERRLGSGGMGEVYRARDARLERQVAVKILRTTNADDREVKRRLLREARAAA